MIALLVKFKWYLIAVGILLLLVFSVWFNVLLKQNQKLKLDNFRLTDNQYQLLQEKLEYTTINLTHREAIRTLQNRLDSLASLVNTKPKFITKIVEKQVIQHDTVERLVQVERLGVDFWKISDSDKCFTWKGTALLRNDSLKVNRVLFDYHNTTTDIFYKYRKYWIFSKWQYLQKSVSECGKSYTREINILKK